MSNDIKIRKKNWRAVSRLLREALGVSGSEEMKKLNAAYFGGGSTRRSYSNSNDQTDPR